MKTRRQGKRPGMVALVALVLGVCAATYGQTPVTSSFSRNGELVCSNRTPGSIRPDGVTIQNIAGAVLQNDNSGNGYLRAVTNTGAFKLRGTNPPPPGMVLIPVGMFTMGDTFSEGDSDELPLRPVYVSAFYMDRYEVTKALWDEVYNWAITHGYSFAYGAAGKAANHPAHTMTWYDAVKWCNARSQQAGRTPVHYTDAGLTKVYTNGEVTVYVNWAASGYRLPTEAEWERAARGGSGGHRFPWSDTENITHSRANCFSSTSYAYDVSQTREYHPTFNDGVPPYTSPVGYFAPNGYGLYDMAGNVWEWCWDWYGGYSSGSQTNPRGPASGSFRVFRGGGLGSFVFYCRAARRSGSIPTSRDYDVGFRSVLSPGQ